MSFPRELTKKSRAQRPLLYTNDQAAMHATPCFPSPIRMTETGHRILVPGPPAPSTSAAFCNAYSAPHLRRRLHTARVVVEQLLKGHRALPVTCPQSFEVVKTALASTALTRLKAEPRKPRSCALDVQKRNLEFNEIRQIPLVKTFATIANLLIVATSQSSQHLQDEQQLLMAIGRITRISVVKAAVRDSLAPATFLHIQLCPLPKLWKKTAGSSQNWPVRQIIFIVQFHL